MTWKSSHWSSGEKVKEKKKSLSGASPHSLKSRTAIEQKTFAKFPGGHVVGLCRVWKDGKRKTDEIYNFFLSELFSGCFSLKGVTFKFNSFSQQNVNCGASKGFLHYVCISFFPLFR